MRRQNVAFNRSDKSYAKFSPFMQAHELDDSHCFDPSMNQTAEGTVKFLASPSRLQNAQFMATESSHCYEPTRLFNDLSDEEELDSDHEMLE